MAFAWAYTALLISAVRVGTTLVPQGRSRLATGIGVVVLVALACTSQLWPVSLSHLVMTVASLSVPVHSAWVGARATRFLSARRALKVASDRLDYATAWAAFSGVVSVGSGAAVWGLWRVQAQPTTVRAVALIALVVAAALAAGSATSIGGRVFAVVVVAGPATLLWLPLSGLLGDLDVTLPWVMSGPALTLACLVGTITCVRMTQIIQRARGESFDAIAYLAIAVVVGTGALAIAPMIAARMLASDPSTLCMHTFALVWLGHCALDAWLWRRGARDVVAAYDAKTAVARHGRESTSTLRASLAALGGTAVVAAAALLPVSSDWARDDGRRSLLFAVFPSDARLFAARGADALAHGRYDEAQAAAHVMAAARAADFERFSVALCLAKASHTDASACVSSMAPWLKRDPDAVAEAVRELLRHHDVEAAYRAADQLLHARPDSALATALLGEAEYARGNMAQARELFTTAFSTHTPLTAFDDARVLPAALVFARLLTADDEPARALAVCGDIVRSADGSEVSVEARLQAALTQDGAGAASAALQAYKDTVKAAALFDVPEVATAGWLGLGELLDRSSATLEQRMVCALNAERALAGVSESRARWPELAPRVAQSVDGLSALLKATERDTIEENLNALTRQVLALQYPAAPPPPSQSP